MAANCPVWLNGKCNSPEGSTHSCSWPDPNFTACAVFKMAGIKAKGGSMTDQLLAAGIIAPGTTVVGGRRALSDREIFGTLPSKKWWQFWR
jgi:hypothetical protein